MVKETGKKWYLSLRMEKSEKNLERGANPISTKRTRPWNKWIKFMV